MDFIGGDKGQEAFNARRESDKDKERLEQATDLEDAIVLLRSSSPYTVKAIKEQLIKDREDEKRNHVLPGIKIEEADLDWHNAEVIVPFTPGQKVKVRRSSGEIDDDWTFVGPGMGGPGKYLVEKIVINQNSEERKLSKSVDLSALIEANKK